MAPRASGNNLSVRQSTVGRLLSSEAGAEVRFTYDFSDPHANLSFVGTMNEQSFIGVNRGPSGAFGSALGV